MPVLRSIESKLESLFEGVFGRAFRTNVQPVELARKLVKEMDDHRNVSVSRVYVPNEYTVYLSPGDREQFESYESQLCEELADYLAEHARRESYVLLTPPIVKLETDDDHDVGVFGIATRMAEAAGRPANDAPPAQAEPNATMVYKPAAAPVPQATEAASPVELGIQREVGVLSWEGQRKELTERRATIGRSKDCDVQVADPNVSRRHAEIRQEGATWWLVDLDSTNGVEVKGKRVKRLKLEDGTRFTIGSTELSFARELRDR
jgi:pSer/pThr/pTyr-binding forkhead associated (FHA) protein